MTQLITAFAPVVLLLSIARQAQGTGFLVARQNHSELEDSPATDGELRRDLSYALNTASTFGHSYRSHLARGAEMHKQQVLRHMWQALPHTKHNRVGAKSLCYLMQRYFIRSGLSIRDLLPGSAGVMEQPCRLVSLYAESVLHGGHELKDFSLDDATSMVAAIEDMLLHSDTELLETVYNEMDFSMPDQVPHDIVKHILENYVVHWLMGHDEEGIQLLLENRSLLEEVFPHWEHLASFAEGRVHSMAYSRAAANVFASGYTFDDVQQIVGGITRSFGLYWQAECSRLKDLLLDLDTDKDGRVPLASFYNVGATSEWRLGESENYLRELGVLDETSRWRGKQVIIPNYMQAASNCIVTTHHYLICCMSACEAIVDEIEVGVGKPVATPDQVLAVIKNITVEVSSLEGAGTQPKVTPKLTAQLRWIATSNGGRVLLHGRLFAQWLHYVFPQECPYPHVQGATKAMTPNEFGETYIATDEEMRLHTENPTTSDVSLSSHEEQVLSLWSAEEELVVDYAPHHFYDGWDPLPWSRHLAIFILATAILLLGIVGAGSHAESVGPKMLKEYY